METLVLVLLTIVNILMIANLIYSLITTIRAEKEKKKLYDEINNELKYLQVEKYEKQ